MLRFHLKKCIKGVVKHIGDILKDNHPKSRHNVIEIGIAPWGVVNERESLIGHGVYLKNFKQILSIKIKILK
jgi:hypothetical protein